MATALNLIQILNSSGSELGSLTLPTVSTLKASEESWYNNSSSAQNHTFRKTGAVAIIVAQRSDNQSYVQNLKFVAGDSITISVLGNHYVNCLYLGYW